MQTLHYSLIVQKGVKQAENVAHLLAKYHQYGIQSHEIQDMGTFALLILEFVSPAKACYAKLVHGDELTEHSIGEGIKAKIDWAKLEAEFDDQISLFAADEDAPVTPIQQFPAIDDIIFAATSQHQTSHLFVVIDTNGFLLKRHQRLLFELERAPRVTLVIPVIVIFELDGLKNNVDPSVKGFARRWLKIIHQNQTKFFVQKEFHKAEFSLEEKHIIQKFEYYKSIKQKQKAAKPNDIFVVNCAAYYASNLHVLPTNGTKEVILLTNDNAVILYAAHVKQLYTCSSSELYEKIKSTK